MYAAVRDVAGRFNTVGLVVAAAMAGLLLPGAETLSTLVTPLVVFLVYGSLRGVSFDRTAVVGLGRLLVGAVAVAFALVPVVAAVSSRYLVPSPARLGVLVAAAAPTTAGSAIVWTRLNDGDVQGVTVAAVVTMALSPLLTPLVLSTLVGAATSLRVLPILRDLAVILVGGAALVRLVPEGAVTDDHVEWLSRMAIPLLVFVSVGSVTPESVGLAALVGVVLVAVVTTAAAFVLARLVGRTLGLNAERVVALSFGGGMKNLGIALLVVGSLGGGSAAPIAVTVFYVTQQFLAGVAASR